MKPLKEIEQFEPLFDLKNTLMYTTFNPDIVENAIVKHLEDLEIKYKCNKEKYKIKFDIEKTEKDIKSVVGVCIRILKVDDEKSVIEFTKTGGDENMYLRHFKDLKKNALAKMNDANLVDEAE